MGFSRRHIQFLDYVCLHIFGSKMDHSCSREEEEEAFKKQVMHDRKSNFRNGQLVPMDRALSHLQTNVGSLLFWHKNRTTSYQKKRQIPIETTEERGLTVSREKVSHPVMDLVLCLTWYHQYYVYFLVWFTKYIEIFLIFYEHVFFGGTNSAE